MNKAVNRLIEKDLSLLDKSMIPNIGKRADGSSFLSNVAKIEKSAYVYRNEIYSYLNKDEHEFFNLGGGDPINYKPFPLAYKSLKQEFFKSSIYSYPLSQGESLYKENICNYLNDIGIRNGLEKVNNDNIIFTQSTTHAFYLILKSILRPYDVVLFTAPTYGLFTYIPERLGGISEFVPLKESDNWLINPQILKSKILEINARLKIEYYTLGYQPKVVAFVNINPHNPLGTILTRDNYDLISSMGKVCKDLGVFLIDDLVYYDLNYNREKPPCPVSSIPEMFDNTISLFGLSKSFGLAGARAGFIVANEIVIRAVRNLIFHQMDSVSTIQARMLSEVFSTKKKRRVCYQKYFKELIERYKFKLDILKCFVNGIDSINKKNRKRIISLLKKHKIDLNSINNHHVRLVLEPQVGFFALLDLTYYKNKQYEDITITSAEDLLVFSFKQARIKFLTGASFAWPNDDLIVRITYTAKDDKFVEMLYKFFVNLKKLSVG